MERRQVEVSGAALDVVIGGDAGSTAQRICASHPAGVFDETTVEFLSDIADATVVCVNPRGIGRSSPVPEGAAYSLEAMVDDIEEVRRHLGIERWVFWGMSGGGWLGQLYASKYPRALVGLVLESVCSCFRIRLADPMCIASPFHSAWSPALERAGLLDPASHDAVGDVRASEWCEVEGIGEVFRRRNGPALLVAPMTVSSEMRAAMPLFWCVDLRKALPKIRAPTLVIGGTADPIVPLSHVQALHEAIAGSRLLVVDAGHVPSTEHRDDVRNAVRSFLQECVNR
jgi:pimeloyl-ACP methyl ester carboxylesterase